MSTGALQSRPGVLSEEQGTALSGLCRTNGHKRGESGAVLVLAMVVLAVLSVMIAGLGQDTRVDLLLSRNLRLKTTADNWGQSGLLMTREMIAHVVDSREEDANVTFTVSFEGRDLEIEMENRNATITVFFGGRELKVNCNATLLFNNGTVVLRDVDNDNPKLARSRVRFQGRQRQEGNSIIIAAGYEGVGKGAGSGGALAMIYSIETTSYAPENKNVRRRMAEIYRFAFGGL